jgi:hypothetical protein
MPRWGRTALDSSQSGAGSSGRRLRQAGAAALDDCLYTLQATIPQLTCLALRRYFQRHGISRLSDIAGDKPGKKAVPALLSQGTTAITLTSSSTPSTYGKFENRPLVPTVYVHKLPSKKKV